MDNLTLCYQGIQRVYRNAVVAFLRKRLNEKYGDQAIAELKNLFRKTSTGEDQWQTMESAAQERRTEGTGEVSSRIRDGFDLLGVNHFYNVFEKFFPILCPVHASKDKADQQRAKSTLTSWSKTIKNLRDPLSHPTEDDFSTDDALIMLISARKILDFLQLPDAARELMEIRARVGESEYLSCSRTVLNNLPPEEEVVLDFVGRNSELATLQDWLQNSHRKRWALSGEGGKGKSAIAYHFAHLASQQSSDLIDAVIWISAKRRRFVEGATLLVDRPNFSNLSSACDRILEAYGFSSTHPDSLESKQQQVRQLLSEFPALVIVDDIDTLEESESETVEFLLMDLPTFGQSKLLLTSRRSMKGLEACTTQVAGFTEADGKEFIVSRCELAGLPTEVVLKHARAILDVTDSSPLFIEDFLRLIVIGMSVNEAVGLWKERRGKAAREYAIRREYEQLTPDAKRVLLALSVIDGSSAHSELTNALGWDLERLIDALSELKRMFLMPKSCFEAETQKLTLNQNTRRVVLDSFKETEALERVKRQMGAVKGTLRLSREEERTIIEGIRRSQFNILKHNFKQAEQILQDLANRHAGEANIFGKLGELYKRMGRTTDAREMFKRACQLKARLPYIYREWARLETDEEEWTAAEVAARTGLEYFPSDVELNYLKGHALQRIGREFCHGGDKASGRNFCDQARSYLERALNQIGTSSDGVRFKKLIYRALVLNTESLEDELELSRLLVAWNREMPGDPTWCSEYVRLRTKFPRYLPGNLV